MGSSLVLSPPILVLLLFGLQFGTALDAITPTKPIKDPEFIVSESGVFRLGFFGFANSTNRYVGILYNQIPVQTVIWVANRNKPLKDSSGVLKISENGNLVILNGQEEILWSSNSNVTNLVVSNTSALLLDSGNLILKNEDDHGTSIWESFQHPFNAYLPTMKLSTNIRTGEKVQLSSWKSPSDPSEGNFSFTLEPLNIPEVVVWNHNQRSFRSGPWNGQKFIGISRMNSVYLDGYSIVSDDQKILFYITYALANKSFLAYNELNYQGKFVARYWDDEKGDWDNFSILKNECNDYGKCGAYGICDSMKPSICSCVRGFEPNNREEWNRENWTSGCVRTTPLQCPNEVNGSEDGFLKLETMKVPAFSEWASANGDSCENLCLKNCSCMAYAYDVGIGCMLWSGDLIDIHKFSTGGTDLYIRLPPSELGEKKGKSIVAIIVIVTVIAAITIISITTFVLWSWAIYRGRKQRSKEKLQINMGNVVAKFSSDNLVGENLIEVKLQQLPLFKFDELATATNNFHLTKKLGQGGFGPVYRGTMQDGNEIAVKRLSRASGQGLEEFMNEVVVISKLQHRNLVRLFGCCVEGEEKMLVYEYLPNKSLDAFLFDHFKREELDWEKRFNIIEGIGRGLLYLHRDSRLRIIHRDLKASNVLLDRELNPKISDFGIARIFGGDENQANTKRVVGTYGYMSPEYAMQGRFSEKSDIFSFGVLLLEIVSGRKNTSFYDNQHYFSLLGYAWDLWKEENILGLLDKGISGSNYAEKDIMRCIHVGLLCVQEFAKDRPTMTSVVSMLNSEIMDLQLQNSLLSLKHGLPKMLKIDFP